MQKIDNSGLDVSSTNKQTFPFPTSGCLSSAGSNSSQQQPPQNQQNQQQNQQPDLRIRRQHSSDSVSSITSATSHSSVGSNMDADAKNKKKNKKNWVRRAILAWRLLNVLVVQTLGQSVFLVFVSSVRFYLCAGVTCSGVSSFLGGFCWGKGEYTLRIVLGYGSFSSFQVKTWL